LEISRTLTVEASLERRRAKKSNRVERRSKFQAPTLQILDKHFETSRWRRGTESDPTRKEAQGRRHIHGEGERVVREIMQKEESLGRAMQSMVKKRK
jgi:hypothetical protein